MGSHRYSRDGARTPMRWDSSPGSGFTDSGCPWLPLGESTNPNDVARQRTDRNSLLNLYRDLIALCRETPALIGGELVPLPTCREILEYERHGRGQRLRIALNLSGKKHRIAFDGNWRVMITTFRDRAGETVSGRLTLRPHEGMIAEARS